MVDFVKQLKKTPRIDLNPSSADRWTTCTASPKFIFDNWDKLPVEDRTFANPGTTAHEVAAALLQGRKADSKACPVPVDSEMNWHGWNYMEFVEGLRESGGRIIVEQKLPLFYAENRNAIVDAAVINNDNLHIVDYKYGEGVIVSPKNNLQGIIYAKSVTWSAAMLGFAGIPVSIGMSWVFDEPDDFPITIHIYQPRGRNAEDSPFHSWQTTWGEIQERAEQIALTATYINLNLTDPRAEVKFAPSEKACQWCPAKGFCTARQTELTKDLEPLAVIDGTPMPLGRVLTEKQLAAIVRHGDEIKKWIDDAQGYALQLMRSGGSIPGFKLVMSRGGHRFWNNPEKAAKYLAEDTILRQDEIFLEPKLVSPSAVEKLLGKGKFPTRVYSLISKPPGQPVIAPNDDPRESALIDGAKEFADLDASPKGDAEKISLDQF